LPNRQRFAFFVFAFDFFGLRFVREC